MQLTQVGISPKLDAFLQYLLEYKQNHILLDYCGLKRNEDWFVDVDNTLSKEDIAARFHLGTEQAVDKTFLRAVNVLRAELECVGWF